MEVARLTHHSVFLRVCLGLSITAGGKKMRNRVQRGGRGLAWIQQGQNAGMLRELGVLLPGEHRAKNGATPWSNSQGHALSKTTLLRGIEPKE